MLLLVFRNDGTGTRETGNYEVTVSINGMWLDKRRVDGHKRAEGWQELVRQYAASLDAAAEFDDGWGG